MAVIWKIDPAHSEIQFKVKHLMLTTITGTFKKFDCTVETETEDFNSTINVIFTADVDSISTNNEQRDTHLKSNEFFDMEKYGQVLFTGTRFDMLQSEATLHGNLTIRGVTKPVMLNVELAGTAIDPYGQKKAGFIVTGKISRKEFGLTWNAVTETGSIVVGDEIKINAEIQLVGQR